MAEAETTSRRSRGATSAGAGGLQFADEARDDGSRAALRRPPAPESGMRVAYSYVVVLLAALVGIPTMIGLANWLYETNRVCVGDDGLACPILWLGGLLMAALAVVLALGAWFFRLGWRWWLAGAALALLLVEIVVDPLSPWLLAGLVVPGLASLASDPALPHRRWRTWGIVALAVVAGGYLMVSLWPS